VPEPLVKRDRAVLLGQWADSFMETGWMPLGLSDGCTDFQVGLWPEAPAEPHEVHFSASWPDVTLVTTRSLAGYSLEGGLR
jgi:hypothetical protein